jgi:predicted Ser/Thr protein kinase
MVGEVKAGRYEVGKEIGRGGMGVVYIAHDARLGRTVALKMIPREVVHNSDLRRRLSQEARASSALSHPGVATVFDFVEQGEESFIVYEYVDGVTLRHRLGEHRFTTEEILDLGIQLAGALAAAHERGIIHRDLKPENLMLVRSDERSGQVKILDFGLAKFATPLTSSSQIGNLPTDTAPLGTAAGLLVGTVNYMSPEQLEGESADARTDLYALGLVLYEMAAGMNPFAGKSPTSTIANILKQEAPPVQERNPASPPELDRILHKCLRKRREERYQSARELGVDLGNLRRDSVEAARPVASSAAALEIPRGLARSLFLFLQVAYLAMYGLAFYDFQRASSLPTASLGANFGSWLFIWVLVAALAGTPLRLYLLSAVVFDYADSGRLFRQMFPIVVIFDLAWAVAPFLLYPQFGLAVLLLIPALAYLPFSQRTLVLSAYAATGGRTSGAQSRSLPSSP